jgi:hypothetical protein
LKGELSKHNTKFFFILNHLSADTFRIELIKNTNNGNLFASLTNRKLLLEKRMYPIVVDFDGYFGVSETGDEILRKAMKNRYFEYKIHFSLYHYFYYVTFIRNGDILKKGYDGLIEKDSNSINNNIPR